MAGAHRHARAPSPGDRLPQLRPARPAQRVQVRGLSAVRGDALEPARGSDGPPHASAGRRHRGRRRAWRGRARSRAIAGRASRPAPERSGVGDGGCGAGDGGWPERRGARREAGARAVAQEARRRRRSERPEHVGQSRPQRAVPLWLRQEIQALPRQPSVSGRVARTRPSRAARAVNLSREIDGGQGGAGPVERG